MFKLIVGNKNTWDITTTQIDFNKQYCIIILEKIYFDEDDLKMKEISGLKQIKLDKQESKKMTKVLHNIWNKEHG